MDTVGTQLSKPLSVILADKRQKPFLFLSTLMRLWLFKGGPSTTGSGCTISLHENMKETEFPEHIKDKKIEEERNVGILRGEQHGRRLEPVENRITCGGRATGF